METTTKIKILATVEEKNEALASMREFNRVCNLISKWAHKNCVWSKFSIQKAIYHDIRKQTVLGSQMVIRAIAVVAFKYKDKAKRSSVSTFHEFAAVEYDARSSTLKDLKSVSLLMQGGRMRLRLKPTGYHRKMFHLRKGGMKLQYIQGDFYLLLTIDKEESNPIAPKRIIGGDMGIVNLIHDSDNNCFKGEDIEKARKRYSSYRGRLQQRGTRSAKRRLKKVSHKESDFRRIENHTISKQLIENAKGTAACLGLEDLAGISKRTTVRKSERAKHKGWAFYQLRTFIEYKAKLAGVSVYFVDPAYTSKGCPSCGHVSDANRPYRDTFQCTSCQLSGPADFIASIHIAHRAADQFGLNVDRPIAATATTREGIVPVNRQVSRKLVNLLTSS